MVLSAYDIEGTKASILEFGASRVALQFPDHMLEDAWEVVSALRRSIPGVTFCVLADTSYGECCVDEVAAEHMSADLIVHYGHCCLSPTSRLPVKYVVPTVVKDIDEPLLQEVVSRLRSSGGHKIVVLVPDLAYRSQLRSVPGAIIAHSAVETDEVVMPSSPVHEKGVFGRYWVPNEDLQGLGTNEMLFLWVGSSESSTLRAIALGHGAASVMVFDPATATEATVQSVQGNFVRILTRRFALIEKVRQAERIAIVPGTLAVAGQREIIDRCRKAIEANDRRCYVVSVGKPTPEKLANLGEIDAFVLVACPENSLVEPRDYFRPVVTPLELLIAFSDNELNPETYSTDFAQALQHEFQDVEKFPEEAHFMDNLTLATKASTAIQTVRGHGTAADYLSRRSWQGLQFKAEGNEPTRAAPGQTGIASIYKKELSWQVGDQSTDW